MCLEFTKADKSLVKYMPDSEILTTKHKIVDNSKSVKQLNHRETTTLRDGVKNTVEWMKTYYGV